YLLADIKGDFQEMVKTKERLHNDELASTYISHLAISKQYLNHHLATQNYFDMHPCQHLSEEHYTIMR
ncbi:MAG: hypothetical protein K6C13_04280, partial [Oscillospiraceae bacterium]|nr:hypothetical protein [Oscillospiraceae bacterium]